MKREDGFYWVRLGRWRIAQWNGWGGIWIIFGLDGEYCDDDFSKIGEQIKKPDE